MTLHDARPRLGVSACVMGQKVRYDGGHKRSHFVSDTLSDVVEFKSLCPEVGMGMSVPRPTIHVRDIDGAYHLTDSKNGMIDHTDKMNAYFEKQRKLIDTLDGFVLAAKSPSCGMERIKVYNADGELMHRKGEGLFVHLLRQHYPHLPMEEDGRLNDAGLREAFVTRVFAYHDFKRTVLASAKVSELVQFQSRYKLLLMAYNPAACRQLGRVVASASEHWDSAVDQYLTILMGTLSKPTTRKKHTNALMHLQGYFKQKLSSQDKKELSEQIDKYRRGYVPLMAPMALLQHHLRHHPDDYVAQQVYLEPYPEELGIRNLMQ